MFNLRTGLAVLALSAAMYSGCTCDPVIPPADGGSGGGGGGATGGGGGATGGGGGTTGGGSATGGGGGGGGGDGGVDGGVDAGAVQFTEWVRDQIVNHTSATATPRAATEYAPLPDDAPIAFSQAFFDGGMN
jgi:hypothetical protein